MELPKTMAMVGDAELRELGQVAKPLASDDEHLGLVGKVGPSRFHQIDQRQAVLPSDVHDPQCFRHGVAGSLIRPGWWGSCARIAHSTPSTTPMPVTTLAPSNLFVPQAASVESSRKGESWSMSSSIRFPHEELASIAVAFDVLLSAALPGLFHQLLELLELLLHC